MFYQLAAVFDSKFISADLGRVYFALGTVDNILSLVVSMIGLI